MSDAYTARIDHGNGGETTIRAESVNEAKKAAMQWAREGEWDTSTGTIYVCLTLTDPDDEDEELWRNENFPIHPAEPKCASGHDHDWQRPHEIVGGLAENPGVWGHGGGVRIHEVCVHCACGRVTDTWAQNPENGVQGLESIDYEPDKYINEIAEDESEWE